MADLAPGFSRTKPQAELHDWWYSDLYGHRFLMGKIRNHDRQKEFVAEYQITSPLVKLDMIAGLAESQNTVYILGPRHKDFTTLCNYM